MQNVEDINKDESSFWRNVMACKGKYSIASINSFFEFNDLEIEMEYSIPSRADISVLFGFHSRMP